MSYQIKIAEPCSEDWNQMTPTQKGAFCASCKKEVIDFTAMSNLELARKISETEKNKQEGGLCGRFRPSQLDTPLPNLERNRWRQSAMAAGFTAVMGISGSLQAQDSVRGEMKVEQVSKSSSSSEPLEKVIANAMPICGVEEAEFENPYTEAQEFESEELEGVLGGMVVGGIRAVPVEDAVAEIRGVVKDQDQLPLPGARVTIVGTELVAHTNFDGEYVLRVDPSLRTADMWLEISHLGYISKTVLLSKFENASEILLVELEEDVMGELVIYRPNIFQRIGNLFRRRSY